MKIEREQILAKLQARYDELQKKGDKARRVDKWDEVDDIAIRLFEVENFIKLIRSFKNK